MKGFERFIAIIGYFHDQVGASKSREGRISLLPGTRLLRPGNPNALYRPGQSEGLTDPRGNEKCRQLGRFVGREVYALKRLFFNLRILLPTPMYFFSCKIAFMRMMEMVAEPFFNPYFSKWVTLRGRGKGEGYY